VKGYILIVLLFLAPVLVLAEISLSALEKIRVLSDLRSQGLPYRLTKQDESLSILRSLRKDLSRESENDILIIKELIHWLPVVYYEYLQSGRNSYSGKSPAASSLASAGKKALPLLMKELQEIETPRLAIIVISIISTIVKSESETKKLIHSIDLSQSNELVKYVINNHPRLGGGGGGRTFTFSKSISRGGLDAECMINILSVQEVFETFDEINIKDFWNEIGGEARIWYSLPNSLTSTGKKTD